MVVLTLVYVFVSGLIFFGIKKQIKIASDSVELQKNSQKQWVDLVELSLNKKRPGPGSIEIGFKIANTTPVPLSLHSVSFQFGAEEREVKKFAQMLAPHNPAAFSFVYPINGTESERLRNGQFGKEIEVAVVFTDSFGKRWQQFFGRTIVCSDRIISDTVETKNELAAMDAQT